VQARPERWLPGRRGAEEETIRAFFALSLPDSVRRELSRVQDLWRERIPRVNWTAPRNFHLTLRFLGNIDPALVEPLAGLLTDVVAARGPLGGRLEEVGAFPGDHRPRVLWVGVENPILAEVAESLELRLAEYGFPRERRPWRSHITLGRIRRQGKGVHMAGVDIIDQALTRLSFTFSGAHLMASTLTPSGPIYHPLASVEWGTSP